jgi:hypothetical protein
VAELETCFFEELLSTCCSLEHLVMDGVFLTPKMAVSICKNGKTLQILSLNSSDLDRLDTPAYNYMQDIIKCCQELREVDLTDGLSNDDVGFLAENLAPNVEKLNLSGGFITDHGVKSLLRRCNKIKELSLLSHWITDVSLENIRQHLKLTLEELNLGPNKDVTFKVAGISYRLKRPGLSFTGFLELKSMPRLRILNLYYEIDDEEIQNLRQKLPHLMIKGVLKIPQRHLKCPCIS